MKRVPRAIIDFETRSAANLKACGTWRYSIDPTTDVLCLAFRLPYWEPGRTGLWHPAFPTLGIDEPADFSDMAELCEWIASGGLVEAHNVFFEYCIWLNVLSPRYGFPPISHAQWRCSAAKAASYALPRGLDDAASALHLRFRKDAEGAKVMKKVSKPRKSRKAERAAWDRAGIPHPTLLWHESLDLFTKLWAYCRTDVLAEEAVSEALADPPDDEIALFLLDLEMNSRGFQLDREAVSTALRLLDVEAKLLNAELAVVTDGYVTKATQRDAMKVWFESEGLLLTDTQGATIDAYLSPKCLVPINPKARRALELMRALGRSSTAKYQAMAFWAGTDWRVRGGLLFHGASTGRWSGKGVQPHNFPKLSPTPKGEKPSPTDIDTIWDALKTKARDYVVSKWGGIMEALSAALRGAIVAAKGHVLYVADFASIEARVLLWCADDQKGLDLFRNHEDMYCDMASDIFGYPTNKADHPKERGLGKIAILGLGYQMGPSKFVDSCEKAGIIIPEDIYCEECGNGLAQHAKANHPFDGDADDTVMTGVKVVTAYRTKYWRVVQMWKDQETSAIAAVQSRQPVACGPVTWIYKAPFLYCELPSGRRLAYNEPRVKSTMMPWGKMKDVLSYMGVDGYTHQWRRQPVYGGLLVENIVQAISRDLMAHGMMCAEATGVYKMVLSVHDELIAEAKAGAGSVREFEQLMSTIPDWGAGCPVEAEGWTGTRYHK